MVSTSDAEKHLSVLNRLDEFNFCGHSHLTNKYVLSPITAEDASGEAVERRPGHKWIINVGSVGQPRDRDRRACLGVFDTDSTTFLMYGWSTTLTELPTRFSRAALTANSRNASFRDYKPQATIARWVWPHCPLPQV